MDSGSRIVLLSIHPQYVEQIASGTKKIEFRKRKFKNSVNKVVVYSTTPVKKIVGYFDIEIIEELSPSIMWKRYASIGGINKADFFAYYINSPKSIGIKIKNFVSFKKQLNLSLLRITPPQSYEYLSEKKFLRICELGEK